MRRCVFFDRDGVINTRLVGRYVQTWEQFELVEEFPSVLRAVTKAGYDAVVVTNQRGVARGLMTLSDVDGIHEQLKQMLRDKYGLVFLDILCCPHEDGECDCRKPAPGMLIEAARRHSIDLTGSWMVGDSVSDMEAGRRAGCRTIYIGPSELVPPPDLRAKSMSVLETLIVKALQVG